jgi:hypothetical protein
VLRSPGAGDRARDVPAQGGGMSELVRVYLTVDSWFDYRVDDWEIDGGILTLNNTNGITTMFPIGTFLKLEVGFP